MRPLAVLLSAAVLRSPGAGAGAGAGVTATDGACALYTAPSSIAGIGFGLFSGRDLNTGDVVGTSAAVSVSAGSLFGSQLNDFAFRSGSGPSEICFGSIMLCNHADDPNVELQWGPGGPAGGGGGGGQALTVAKRPIAAGEELFISYGGETWFSSRGIVRAGQQHQAEGKGEGTGEDMPSCLSDVYISESKLSGAGRGVFSEKSVKKGDVIMISPVLFLPKKRFLRSALSGYLLADPAEEVALLPLGAGAIANHASLTDSNARICWHRPRTAAREAVAAGSTSDVGCGDYVPDLLDGDSRTKMDLVKGHKAEYFISYVATKDISAGEEIYLHYGGMFNGQGVNEVLLRGSSEFESSASPMVLDSSCFSTEFRASPYKDSFREEALAALTSLGVGELRELFSKKVADHTHSREL
jgi:hypothetical protein